MMKIQKVHFQYWSGQMVTYIVWNIFISSEILPGPVFHIQSVVFVFYPFYASQDSTIKF